MNRAVSFIRRFATGAEGATTVGGLFFTLGAAMLGGLAVDQANAWRVQTHMQAAADAAALAAVAHVDDLDTARAIGTRVAEMNLGRSGIVTDADYVFGTWDAETRSFSPGEEGTVNAVRVSAARTTARSNEVPTFLLKLVGRSHWDIAVSSLTTASFAERDCDMGAFISTGHIETGGGNRLEKGVCIHGETGVATGGGDHYDRAVTFSSPSLDAITIASYNPHTIPEEELKLPRSIAPAILPVLDETWAELWSALYDARPAQYAGDLLPDFVYEGGPADVVIKEGPWSIQPGDLEKNAIYVVNGDAQFAGGMDVSNIAFVVNGSLGVGGGDALHFEDVFFFGNDLDLAGNIKWGPLGIACNHDAHSVYLFGRERLSMGGWGNAVSANGVIGAAPVFEPGGNMTGRDVYFEMGYLDGRDSTTSLGGDLLINGNDCLDSLDSAYPLADLSAGRPQGGILR